MSTEHCLKNPYGSIDRQCQKSSATPPSGQNHVRSIFEQTKMINNFRTVRNIGKMSTEYEQEIRVSLSFDDVRTVLCCP